MIRENLSTFHFPLNGAEFPWSGSLDGCKKTNYIYITTILSFISLQLGKDVVADYESLKANGVAVAEVQSAPWGKFTTFTDPDGNGWVLQQSTM